MMMIGVNGLLILYILYYILLYIIIYNIKRNLLSVCSKVKNANVTHVTCNAP